MNRRRLLLALVAGLVFLVFSVPVLAQDDPPGETGVDASGPDELSFEGQTDCPWGSRYCNPCVNNVEAAFNSLRSHGDIITFHIDQNRAPARDPWEFIIHHHWQGVQRLMSGDGRNLVVTLDHTLTPITELIAGLISEGYHSIFQVVELGTRAKSGDRFRSNVLLPMYDFKDTIPDTRDKTKYTDIISTDNGHPGGIQAMGDILAIPADRGLYFYDMKDPHNPGDPFLTIDPLDDLDIVDGEKKNSAVALTQLWDGTFLFAVYTNKHQLDFYYSTSESILDSSTKFAYVHWWNADDLLLADDSLHDWDSYQSINFVTECGTGKLYLIATGNQDDGSTCYWKELANASWFEVINYPAPVWDWFLKPNFKQPCWPNGPDKASLIEVTYYGSGDEITLNKVAERHFYCDYRGKPFCNFDAAAGVYVDPNHQLYLYATEHAADGAGGTVKAMEFRPVPHSSCLTTDEAWVELYEPKWGQGFDRGRGLMIDYVDRAKEYYANYDKVEDFEDRAHSAAWCLPENLTYMLYHDKNPCKGAYPLTGTGSYQYADIFRSVEPSCSWYVFEEPVSVRIDPTQGWKIEYERPPRINLNQAASVNQPAADPIVTVDVPPGAFPDTMDVTYTPVSPPSQDIAPLYSTGYGFDLQAQDTQATVQAAFEFDLPLEVTIDYVDADIEGFVESSLGLYYWDQGAAAWVDATTTCTPQGDFDLDTRDNTLQAEICKTGEYAMLGNTNPVRVLVDELHDNRMTLDPARAQAIADEEGGGAQPEWFMLEELAASAAPGYEFQSATSGSLTDAALNGYDILLIPPYKDDMTANEVSAVLRFVATGGGLIVSGDNNYQPPNPELHGYYGIEFVPQCVYEPVPQLEPALDLVATDPHPALGGATGAVFFYSEALRLAGRAERILSTGENAWQDSDWNASYDEDEDETGRLPVAAVNDTGCGRMVALADSQFADADLGWTDNEDLMQGLLDWTASGRSCDSSVLNAPARVLVDEAHDQQLSLDWTRAGEIADQHGGDPDGYHLGSLEDKLSGAFSLHRNTKTLTLERLAAYDALLIPPYRQAMSSAEVNAINEYVQQGGGLVLLGNADYALPNTNLVSSYGIQLEPYAVVVGDEDPDYQFDVLRYADHPAVPGPMGYTYDYGQGLALSGDAEDLMNTGFYYAWQDKNDNDSPDGSEAGILHLDAAYDGGCGRVVVLGDDGFNDYTLQWTDNEHLLRSLLTWVTETDACHKKVWVDEAHDNYLTLDWDRATEIVTNQGYSSEEYYVLRTLEDRLETSFSFYSDPNEALTEELLADYDALVIPWHFDTMTSAEVEAVENFVAQGGGLLFIGNSAYDNPNPGLISTYGMQFENYTVYAPVPQDHGDILIDSFADHAAVSGVTDFAMHWGCSLEFSGGAFSLADTSGKNAWRDIGWDETYKEGVDDTGPFDIVGAWEGKCGRVAAISDDAFGDAALDDSQNEVLFGSVLQWVTLNNQCGGEPTVYLPMVLRNH